MIYQACFNTSQWLFAFEYFSIALAMPLAIKGLQPKPSKRLKILKIVGLVLNLAVAFLIGLFLFLQLYGDYRQKDVHLYELICVVLNVTVTILELASGGFILFSVFTIRRFIKKGLQPYQLNERNLALHAAAFSFYTVGLIAQTCFFAALLVKGSLVVYLCSSIVTNFLNYVSQLLLCSILFNLGKPLEMPPLVE